MKRKRFTEEQIVEILKEVESGVRVPEVGRKYGVSNWTIYQWRQKYSGMDIQETRRVKELERENSQLKRIVADQAVDIRALKDVVSKKW